MQTVKVQQRPISEKKSSHDKRSSSHGSNRRFTKEQLRHVRVVQLNLVYVIGIPPSIAKESALRKPTYFGQYGRIQKVVVNKGVSASNGRPASASAYITFFDAKAAQYCIKSGEYA